MKMSKENYESLKQKFDYILENADDKIALYFEECIYNASLVALNSIRKNKKLN